MRRSILLLTSFIIVTVNFAFADSDNAKSKPLRWNSPEIFSRWFKTTSSMSDLETLSFIDCGYQILANQVINYRYKSELLLFVDLALGDYLKTPNLSEGVKNSTILFEHFSLLLLFPLILGPLRHFCGNALLGSNTGLVD